MSQLFTINLYLFLAYGFIFVGTRILFVIFRRTQGRVYHWLRRRWYVWIPLLLTLPWLPFARVEIQTRMWRGQLAPAVRAGLKHIEYPIGFSMAGSKLVYLKVLSVFREACSRNEPDETTERKCVGHDRPSGPLPTLKFSLINNQ